MTKKKRTTDVEGAGCVVADLDSVPLDTFTIIADHTCFCDDPTPEQLAQLQEMVNREVPLAISAFQEAQRALALDPTNMANVERLADRVEELKQLSYVAEAIAWEPTMGITIVRHM